MSARLKVFLGLIMFFVMNVKSETLYQIEEVKQAVKKGYTVYLDNKTVIDPYYVFVNKENILKIKISKAKKRVTILRHNESLLVSFTEVKNTTEHKNNTDTPISVIMIGNLPVEKDEFEKYMIEKSAIANLEILQACDFDSKHKTTILTITTSKP